MQERHFKLLVIFTMLSGVLLQYQNCGSPKNADASVQIENLDPNARDRSVINDVSVGGIQFLQNKTAVQAADSEFRAYGTCAADQQGAMLSWKVVNQDEQVLANGKSLCNEGLFEVHVVNASDLSCEDDLVLKAAFGAKAKAESVVDKSCI